METSSFASDMNVVMIGDKMAVPPFFVVGSDRSGTTLLRLMLNAHPALHVPRESEFVVDLVAALPISVPLSPTELAAGLDIMTHHRRWGDLEIGSSVLKDYLDTLHSPTLRDLASAPFEISRMRAGKRRWGDKTPGYVTHIPELAALFPDAKFVHIIRDARDVCLSFKLRGWRGGLPAQARFWAGQVGRGISDGRQLGDRYYELRYEDLVLDSGRALDGVCAFLGEDFDAAMLSFYRSAAREIAPWEHELHDKLIRPPRPKDVGRWKRQLRMREVIVIEALAGPVMDAVPIPRHMAGLWRLAPATVAVAARGYEAFGEVLDTLGWPRPPVSEWLGIAYDRQRETTR